MIIATFGPTTAWVGKSITREGHVFVLEGHGPISAQDVMEYDRQGNLAWATDGTRAWVEAMAEASRVSQAAPPAITTASSATNRVPGAMAPSGVPGATAPSGVPGAMAPSVLPTPGAAVHARPRSTGLEGVSRGDWVVVAGSLAMFFGMLLTWTADRYSFAGGWFPMLAAIAAVVVVVLSSGVIPERRYEMSGRAPLIIMGLGAVAFLIVLIGMIVQTADGWEAGSSVALLGAAAVLGGGFLKMRDPVVAVPVAAAVFAGNAMQAANVAFTPPRASAQTPGETPGSSGARATGVEPPPPGTATLAQADPRSADTIVEPPATAEPPVPAASPVPVASPVPAASSIPIASSIPVASPVPVDQPASGPATAEAPADPPATSVADEIAKLAELREKGMLTDDEFAAFKARLME